MKFDRTSVRLLSQEIEQALQDVANKRGIQIKSGNATWLLDGTSLTLPEEAQRLARDLMDPPTLVVGVRPENDPPTLRDTGFDDPPTLR